MTQASGTLSGQPPTLPSWLQPTNPQPVVTQQGDTTLPTSQPATQRQTANPTDAAQPGDTPPPAMQPLQLHPFSNPSLPPIPARLLKSIQARLYIDLSELLPEALADAFDRPPSKEVKEDQGSRKRFIISNPLDWGLAFATFAAACSHYHPEMAPKLLVYCGIIFRLAREVEGSTWLRYDKAFRQAAAINPALRWDQREPDIWLASLTGHSSTGLPPAPLPREQTSGAPPLKRSLPTSESCFRWNRGECSSRTCKYNHDCLICHETAHTARDCPTLRPTGWRPPSIPRAGGYSKKSL